MSRLSSIRPVVVGAAKAVRYSWKSLLLGGILLALVDGVVAIGHWRLTHPAAAPPMPMDDAHADLVDPNLVPGAGDDEALLRVTVIGGIYLLRLLLQAWVRPGYIRHQHRGALGGAVLPLVTLFSVDRFVPYVVAVFVAELLPVVAAAALAAPGLMFALAVTDSGSLVSDAGLLMAVSLGGAGYFYLWLGFYLTPWTVSLHSGSIRDALTRSWDLAKGRRSTMALLLLVSAVLQVISLGGLALVVVGFPVAWGAARVYRDALLTQVYTRATSSQTA